jgi:AcrR family transcriptional regulator
MPDRPQGPEIRERIFRAARAQFARHGYHGTTTRGICNAAQVPLGSLHYYFRSKELLYVDVVESLLKEEAEFAGEIERELASEGRALSRSQKLERLVDRWVGFLFDHPEIARIGLHRIAEHGVEAFPASAPPVLPSGRSVAALLSRIFHVPRTLGLRACILAANDIAAGFVGGSAHHAQVLGTSAGSPAYRRLAKRTVLELFASLVERANDGA